MSSQVEITQLISCFVILLHSHLLLVSLVDGALADLDALRIPDTRVDELVGLGVQVLDAVIMGCDVGFQKLVLLAEILD